MLHVLLLVLIDEDGFAEFDVVNFVFCFLVFLYNQFDFLFGKLFVNQLANQIENLFIYQFGVLHIVVFEQPENFIQVVGFLKVLLHFLHNLVYLSLFLFEFA